MYLLTNLFNTIKRLYNESDCTTLRAYESIYMHDEPLVIVEHTNTTKENK